MGWNMAFLKELYNDVKGWAEDNIPYFDDPFATTKGSGWQIEWYSWGFIFISNHFKTCWLLLILASSGISELINRPFPYNLAIFGTIMAHHHLIKIENDNSGGRGVKMYFVHNFGMIRVNRRGIGYSPCPIDETWWTRYYQDEYEQLAAVNIHLV